MKAIGRQRGLWLLAGAALGVAVLLASGAGGRRMGGPPQCGHDLTVACFAGAAAEIAARIETTEDSLFSFGAIAGSLAQAGDFQSARAVAERLPNGTWHRAWAEMTIALHTVRIAARRNPAVAAD